MKLNKSIAVSSLLLPALAMAQEAGNTTMQSSPLSMGYLAAGLGLGIAAAGVGYAQSRAAAAALEGIARNPSSAKQIFVPLILSLAFMEAFVLLTFVVCNNLAGK